MNILAIAHLDHSGDSGDAAAIRTNFIIRGLIDKGCSISVVSYAISRSNKIAQGSAFKYLIKEGSESFFLNIFMRLFVMPIRLGLELLSNRDCGYYIIDRIPFYLTLPVFFASKLFNKKLIWIVNEFPIELARPDSSFLKKLIENISFYFLGKGSSLVVVISNEHKKYFKKYTNKKTTFVVIPILMELSDLAEVQCNQSVKKRIVYGGALSESNGVDFLVSVAAKLVKVTTDFEFLVFGPASNKYKEGLIGKIEAAGLKDYFTILPAVDNKLAIELLSAASILIIPKLDDARATGYIPAKLGDYLHTGRPVVSSNLGDVSCYIEDGVSGYLVDAGSTESFCNCLAAIIFNYESAKEVGKRGAEISKLFEYSLQANKIYLELIKLGANA